MNKWSAAWLAWAGAFVVIETAALRRKGRHNDQIPDTLSRNIQWLVLRGPWVRRATLAAWAGFGIWFGFHIW